MRLWAGSVVRQHWKSLVALYENADVRLRNGAADIDALRSDVNDIIAPGPTLPDCCIGAHAAVEQLALLTRDAQRPAVDARSLLVASDA